MPPRIRDAAEQIAASVRALQDSATLIESFRPFESMTDETKATIARNWRHREIMLAKQPIIDAMNATPELQAKKSAYEALISEVKPLAPYTP